MYKLQSADVSAPAIGRLLYITGFTPRELRQHHQIVPVDHFVEVFLSENGPDLLA